MEALNHYMDKLLSEDNTNEEALVRCIVKLNLNKNTEAMKYFREISFNKLKRELEDGNININCYKDFVEEYTKIILYLDYPGSVYNFNLLLKQHVTNRMRSNLVTTRTSEELIRKAYKVINDCESLIKDIKAIKNLSYGNTDLFETYEKEAKENLNMIFKIYKSYLEILNLKTYKEISQDYINKLNTKEIIKEDYLHLMFCESILKKRHDIVLKDVFNNIDETFINECANNSLRFLSNLETVKVGKRKKILLVSKKGHGTAKILDTVVTFISPTLYESYKDTLGFTEFDTIKKW